MKIHSSCEIEDFVGTHLCKLCVILRSRVFPIYRISWSSFLFGLFAISLACWLANFIMPSNSARFITAWPNQFGVFAISMSRLFFTTHRARCCCCCSHINSHNQVRGHRTGSSHSGAEEYPSQGKNTHNPRWYTHISQLVSSLEEALARTPVVQHVDG